MASGDDVRSPITWICAGVAAIGWMLFAWSFATSNNERAQNQTAVEALRHETDDLGTQLKALQAASGSVPDIEAKRSAAVSEATAAKTTAAAATHERDEALSQIATAKEATAQVNAAREAAEKAAAEASTERDRIIAETASAQQGKEALNQQVAQLTDQLAGRRGEQASLDRQTADLREALSGLGAERDGATKALAEATVDRERAATEVAAAQQTLEAVRAQAAQMDDEVKGRSAELATLQQDFDRAKAAVADRDVTERETLAARDALNQLNAELVSRRDEAAAIDKQSRELQEVLSRLSADRDVAAKALGDATTERERVGHDTAAAQQSVDALNQEAATIAGRLQEHKADLAGSEKQLEVARSEQVRLDQQIGDRREALRRLGDQVSAAQQDLAGLTQQGEVIRRAGANLQAEVAQQNEAAATAIRQRTEADAARAEATRKAAEAAKTRDIILSDLGRGRTALTELEAKVASLNGVVDQRNHDLDDLGRMLRKANAELSAVQSQVANERQNTSQKPEIPGSESPTP